MESSRHPEGYISMNYSCLIILLVLFIASCAVRDDTSRPNELGQVIFVHGATLIVKVSDITRINDINMNRIFIVNCGIFKAMATVTSIDGDIVQAAILPGMKNDAVVCAPGDIALTRVTPAKGTF